jgi:DNA-binding CsgD family transcriptional regulator
MERFESHRAAVTASAPETPHLTADRLQIVAEHARAVGADDPAAWAAAADAWAALEHRYDVAVARWRQGAAALAVGRSGAAAAADPLREAHRLASAMGAHPVLAAVEALARRGRIAIDGNGVTAVPATDTLTTREREVLALVAEGRTNQEIAERLFISAKTASVHVTNIKQKLGVATRVEAATLAVRAGIAAETPLAP